MEATLLAQSGTVIDPAAPAFTWIDWGVVAVYLVFTTLLGARLAGKQATIRDFFLGGRSLPWWAVCGSTIATEVSTATFVAVPAISFAAGGNLTYLQLAIGSIVARIIVALYFIPRYYEKEIYSPYDYAGARLGRRVKTATTALFTIGAILGQGARLYTSAFALSVIADVGLPTAIWLMGAFSILWAMIGGISMVIWTDVIQFFILMLGAGVALCYAIGGSGLPLADAYRIAADAEKFTTLNFTPDLAVTYTFWVGLLATPFINLAAFGTDQVMTQRIFCCRSQRDAAKATIVSSASILIALAMLLLGVALYVYFRVHPFTEAEQARYDVKPTYLLPIFIVRALPVGVRGIIIAAVFAAAVSTLESALAALAQASSGPILKRFAQPEARGRSRKKTPLWKREVPLSKALVVAWGVVLCAMATLCILLDRRYTNTIDLVLALAGFTYGPLLGIFLLAFLPKPPSDAGLSLAVPLAILAVFAISQHDIHVVLGGREIDLTDWIVWSGCLAALGVSLLRLSGDVRKVFAVTLAVIVIALLHRWQVGVDPAGKALYPSFPWSYPVGPIFTFVLGYVLGIPDPPAGVKKRQSARHRIE